MTTKLPTVAVKAAGADTMTDHARGAKLPKPWVTVRLDSEWADAYTADQMRAMWQQGHDAALAQPAARLE